MSTPSWAKPGDWLRRKQRAEKDALALAADGHGDRAFVIRSAFPRPFVDRVEHHAKIDAQPDQDRAQANRDHVQLAKNERTQRDGDDAAQGEHGHDREQRAHAPEAEKENGGHEQHRAQDGRDDIPAHGEGKLANIRRAAGDEDLRGRAGPIREGAPFEILDLAHDFLAGVRAEVGLFRLGQNDAQRAIRRSERAGLLDGKGTRERLERGGDEAKRIEIQLKLRLG